MVNRGVLTFSDRRHSSRDPVLRTPPRMATRVSSPICSRQMRGKNDVSDGSFECVSAEEGERTRLNADHRAIGLAQQNQPNSKKGDNVSSQRTTETMDGDDEDCDGSSTDSSL